MVSPTLAGVRFRTLPVLAGAVTLVVLLLPTAGASAQPTSVKAAPSAEAWYRTVPAPPAAVPVPSPCPLPVGCSPGLPTPLPTPPPSQYAAGTLHVGVLAGAEESRTYLTLDLSALPSGSQLSGGTLTLPIASDPQAGTASPDTAKLRACLVSDPVKDGVDGDVQTPPKADCATSSPASYVAAAGQVPAQFKVDLAPFSSSWTGGSGSLVIVPAAGLAPTDAFHVAFSRRDRKLAGAVPISAELTATEPASVAAPPVSLPPADGGAPLSANLSGVPLDSGVSFAAPPLAAPVTPPIAAQPTPRVAAPVVRRPVRAAFSGAFAYPVVFLLPLLVAGAVGWASRAFTRELVVVRA